MANANDINIIDILDQKRVEHTYHPTGDGTELEEAPISSKALTGVLDDLDDLYGLSVIEIDDKGADKDPLPHVKELAFGGKLVTVQPVKDNNGDFNGRVNIFIRECTDYMSLAAASLNSSLNFDTKYVWKSGAEHSYALPKTVTDLIQGKYPTQYNFCIAKNNILELTLIGDEIDHAGESSYVVSHDNINDKIIFRVSISENPDEDIIVQTASLNDLSTSAPNGGTQASDFLSITWGKIHKIDGDDIKLGKTPDTVEITGLKFKIDLTSKKIKKFVSIKEIKLASDTNSNDTNIALPTITGKGIVNDIVVYEPDTTYPVEIVSGSTDSISMLDSGLTKIYISGIEYISSGTLEINGRAIENSFYIVSTDINRFKIISQTSGLLTSSLVTKTINCKDLHVTPNSNWDSDSNISLNGYQVSFSSTSGSGCFSGNISFEYGYYDRSNSYKAIGKLTYSGNINTKLSKSSSTYEDFINENTISGKTTKEDKGYKRYGMVPGKNTTIDEWNSTDYLKNTPGLLVQDGNLYWPSEDKTGIYTMGTYKITKADDTYQTRTYIRKFWNEGVYNNITAFSVKITGKNLDLFDNDLYKIYIWPCNMDKSRYAMRIDKDKKATGALAGYESETNGIAVKKETNGSASITLDCQILESILTDANKNNISVTQNDGFWLYIEAKSTSPVIINTITTTFTA